jgi:hypothetical protein
MVHVKFLADLTQYALKKCELVITISIENQEVQVFLLGIKRGRYVYDLFLHCPFR